MPSRPPRRSCCPPSPSPLPAPLPRRSTPPGCPDQSPSPSRPARCLMAFNEEGKPAGIALYFYNYSTWRARPGIYLEDLFVRETERKKGFGKRLLVALAKEVVAFTGGRLEWSVLKWNEPSIKLLREHRRADDDRVGHHEG